MPDWVRDQRAEFEAMASLTFTRERLAVMGDLPEPLRTVKAAADRVGHNVAVTVGLELEYSIRVPEADGSYWCGPNAAYTSGDDIEGFVAVAADSLSEWVCETLVNLGRLDEARTWPRCPAHEHSLDPVESDGVAVWRCRDDPSILARVGDLPSVP
jgi:hypothetical protein